jgi:hypothetical protein
MSLVGAMKARVPLRCKVALRSAAYTLRTGRRLLDRWAIGLYRGPSPLDLRPAFDDPILVPGHVTDADAAFVADPFLLCEGGTVHLFFEYWNRRAGKGEIGLATSRDWKHWSYERTVLREDFHLSYPYVFAWEGEHYLVPESYSATDVRLYQAVDFPQRWELRATLLEGGVFNDSSLVHHDGRWWMFTETDPGMRSDTLRLFTASDLLGPWAEHPLSPVITGDRRRARPAGRVVSHGAGLVRYAQDCEVEYGKRVRAFEVGTLTTTAYAERPAGVVLGPNGESWSRHGMHHVDPLELPDGHWLACVDGR